jgi:hypothetical protein
MNKAFLFALTLASCLVTTAAFAQCQSPSGADHALQLQNLLDNMPNLPTSSRAIVLCPNTVWNLQRTLVVPAGAAYTKIYTAGFPTDASRAVLQANSVNTAAAIDTRTTGFDAYGNFIAADYVELRNIQFDGGLTRGVQTCAFRACWDDQALLRMGGATYGQVVDSVKAWGSRTSSTVYFDRQSDLSELDYRPGCAFGQISNSEFLDAGESATGKYSDGIRLKCSGTKVFNNTITDATDVGIAIFGSPGLNGVTTQVYNNLVRTSGGPGGRGTIGGISMVDLWDTNDGQMVGLEVFNNTIQGNYNSVTRSGYIQIGIAMGRKLICEPQGTDLYMHGANVHHNQLLGKMGYGFIIDGVQNWTFVNNTDSATHFGSPTDSCWSCGGFPSPRGYIVHYDVFNPQPSGHAQGTFQPGYTVGCTHGVHARP